MDFLTIQKHVNDLQIKLRDFSFIQRVFLTVADGFVLKLKQQKQYFFLVSRVLGSSQSIYLAKDSEQLNSQNSFISTASRLLTNGQIIDIGLHKNEGFESFERVVLINISVKDSLLGGITKYVLIIELIGANAGIFVCDNNMKILDSLTRSKKKLIGSQYYLEQKLALKNPLNMSKSEVETVLTHEPREWAESLIGFSPSLRQEILYRSLNDLQKYDAYIEIASELANKKTAWAYYKKDKLKVVSAYQCRFLNEFDCMFFDSVNDALLWVENELEAPSRLTNRKKQLELSINKQISSKNSLLNEQKKLLKNYNNHEELQKIGNLIVTNIYNIKPYQKELIVKDFESEKTITIKIDPYKLPAANAAKYFHQAKKAKRGIVLVQKRIKEIEDDLSCLADDLWFVQNATKELDLPVSQTNKKNKVASKKSNKPKFGSSKKQKEFFSPILKINNCSYYAGKNAAQNDKLTFQFANKNDYWFHVLGGPGSHVILKKFEGEPDENELYVGALIAAQFSYAKQARKLSVAYTRVANLKKMAAPGRVIINKYSSIFVDLLEANKYI